MDVWIPSLADISVPKLFSADLTDIIINKIFFTRLGKALVH
jgi:hypothetical protein